MAFDGPLMYLRLNEGMPVPVRFAKTYHMALAALLVCLFFGMAPALASDPSAHPFAMQSGQPEKATNSEPASKADTISAPSGPFSALLYRAMRMQQDYFRGLAKAFRNFNLEGSISAAAALIGLSFAYGIFHAVGPGHGKFIVTSYLLADERDVRRGIGLAFLSSLAQALTAIILVGALAILLGLTHRAVADAIPAIERASFLLVIAVGLVLVWRAVKGGHGHSHSHGHGHGHGHGHEHHEHDHAGHAHLPSPQTFRNVHDWRDMAGVILAIGLRPCTGAVLVLLFALTQEAFLIGALSAFAMSIGTAITVSLLAVLTLASKSIALRLAGVADNGWTTRIERGLKIAGGLLILLLGMTMLANSLLMPAQPLL